MMISASRYLCLFFLFVSISSISHTCRAEARDDEDFTLVGRISHIEGKLLRYVEEEKDWVVTVKDAPFGLNDALYSGDNAKAEFIMPNRTWLRIGEDTQVQLMDLTSDSITVDVASGLARLYNKSEDVAIKATTPFGDVVALGGSIFDLYVGDESLEVIAVKGEVEFIHHGSRTRFQVMEGESSIIADDREVTSGNGTVDADWDDWNDERDQLWASRLRHSQYSAGFLPAYIEDESYYLEDNGQWERIYYEGAYRDVWRPTRVERGWRPFTAGRWSVYYGDNCWVPDEPFGYVTHHYGSWIYVESSHRWYWLPPAEQFVSDRPEAFISFTWHPGRVAWIHSGSTIGWVPLAPDEEYYGHRHWGPRTVVIRPQTRVNIDIVRYRYLDEAVVIPQDDLYRGTRYTPVVRRDVNRDVIVNDYRPVTVINNTVINNFNVDKRRFAFNDAVVERKPHASVVNRITANERTISQTQHIDRNRIERDLTRFNVQSQPPPRAEVPKPVVSTKLVDPDKVTKPIADLSLKQKEIKPQDREKPVKAQGRRPQGGIATQQAGGRGSVPQPREEGSEQVQVPGEPGRLAPQGPSSSQVDKERPQPKEIPDRRRPERPGEVKGQAEGAVQGEAFRPEERSRLRSPRETQQEGQLPLTPEGPRGPHESRRPVDLSKEPPPRVEDLRPEEQSHLRSPRDSGASDTAPHEQIRQQRENQLREQQLQQRQEEDRQRQEHEARQQQAAAEATRLKKEQDQARQQEIARQRENQLREQQLQQRQAEERQRQEHEARQRQEDQEKQRQQAAEAARLKKEQEVRQQEQVQKEHQQREQQKGQQEKKKKSPEEEQQHPPQ